MMPNHELRSLDERRIEIAEKIATGIEARLKGGPNLKDEHLALIEGLASELPAEEIAGWLEQATEDWDRANTEAPPIQPAQPRQGVYNTKGRRIMVVVKPPPQQQTRAKTDEGPQIDAALSVSENTQPKGKADDVAEPAGPLVRAEPMGMRVGFIQQPTPSGLCLNPETPMDNAQAILSLRAWHAREQVPMWRYWQKSFWQWHNGCWREVDDDTVRSAIWHELNAAEKPLKRYRVRFEPKPSDVSATLEALKAAVNLPADKEMPGWFGDGQPEGEVRELVACANGILHIPTRTLLKHTPKFWSPNILDFDFNPEAVARRFKHFLREVWPGDDEAQEGLAELYGLCLTDVTEYHKAFMFIGPPRGGRGTMGRVLRGLIGAQNYIGTSLKRFGEPFGMESFIGKKVAVFTDATLDGFSPRSYGNIVEQLKQITGEDDIDINRKNRRYWHGKLTTRIVIFSNELLRLEDQSGALAERFVVWRMRESFKDRMDTKLTDKLLGERSGILNLALDGWDRVKARGGLRQPASGFEMSESFAELGSDVARFVADCCVVGKEHDVQLQVMYVAWKNWCERHGLRYGWGDNQFSEKLRSAVPTITSSRPRKDNPKRLTVLLGIAVRKKS